MLDYLRKNASSFFSKLILGVIALIFALYFGFSGGGAPQGGTAPIAKVNGQNIPNGLFSQAVQNQITFYQNMGQPNISGDLQKVIESQALQRLINNVLLSQTARKLGLRITDEEVAEAIRQNPSFRRDGIFDENFYLKQFKPYYQRQNGQDYEYTLRENLLQDRFREVLDQTTVVSEQHLKDTVLVQDIQLTLRKLEVPFGPDQPAPSRQEAQQVAKDWIQAKKDKKSTADLLNKAKVKEMEIGPKSLQILQNFFGGADSLPILYCLLQIPEGEVCQEPFQIGEIILAVELLGRQKTEPGPEQYEKMRQQLVQANKTQIFTGVTNLLVKEAKIETFLNQR